MEVKPYTLSVASEHLPYRNRMFDLASLKAMPRAIQSIIDEYNRIRPGEIAVINFLSHMVSHLDETVCQHDNRELQAIQVKMFCLGHRCPCISVMIFSNDENNVGHFL